jgi:hypothetical protein
VDGNVYRRVEDIPDLKDREMIAHMIPDENDPPDEDDLELEFRESLDEMNRAPKPFAWLLLAVLGGVAAVMMIIMVSSAISTVQTLSREQSTAGVVVDTVSRPHRDSETGAVTFYIYPLVEYTTVGGTVLRVELPEGSTSPVYKVGDEVIILYNPANPRDARIDSTSSGLMMWITPGVTFLVGAGFLAAALGFIRLWAPWRKRSVHFPDL